MKQLPNKAISLLLLSTFTGFTFNVLANEKQKDYDAGYYEDGGDLLFKMSVNYSLMNSDLKKLPPATNALASLPKDLSKGSYGINAATTYFFAKYIAAELAVGVSMYKIKSSTIGKIYDAYGRSGTTPSSKSNRMYNIPATALVQYHIAPFGGIRPYLGAGYHVDYNLTRSKAVKISLGHGPVLQAGVNLFAKDDTFVNIDVKRYFTKANISFLGSFLNKANDIKSSAKMDSTMISLGLGFKF